MGAALLYWRCGGPENVGERIQLEQYLKPGTFASLRTTEIKKDSKKKKSYIESAKIFKCLKKERKENVISTREIMHVFSSLKSGSCHIRRLYKYYKKNTKKIIIIITTQKYQTWKWFHNFIVLLKFCHAIDVHTLTVQQLLTAKCGFGFNCQHLSSASSAVLLFV